MYEEFFYFVCRIYSGTFTGKSVLSLADPTGHRRPNQTLALILQLIKLSDLPDAHPLFLRVGKSPARIHRSNEQRFQEKLHFSQLDQGNKNPIIVDRNGNI